MAEALQFGTATLKNADIALLSVQVISSSSNANR